VCVSRLVYRKGADLLVGILAKICNNFPEVDFLIGSLLFFLKFKFKMLILKKIILNTEK
jgi:hypothetical protein